MDEFGIKNGIGQGVSTLKSVRSDRLYASQWRKTEITIPNQRKCDHNPIVESMVIK